MNDINAILHSSKMRILSMKLGVHALAMVVAMLAANACEPSAPKRSKNWIAIVGGHLNSPCWTVLPLDSAILTASQDSAAIHPKVNIDVVSKALGNMFIGCDERLLQHYNGSRKSRRLVFGKDYNDLLALLSAQLSTTFDTNVGFYLIPSLEDVLTSDGKVFFVKCNPSIELVAKRTDELLLWATIFNALRKYRTQDEIVNQWPVLDMKSPSRKSIERALTSLLISTEILSDPTVKNYSDTGMFMISFSDPVDLGSLLSDVF